MSIHNIITSSLPVMPMGEQDSAPDSHAQSALADAGTSTDRLDEHHVKHDKTTSSILSVTPPPSTQQLARPSRSSTPRSRPSTSYLSSPPPTVGAYLNAPRPDVAKDDVLPLSDERIRQASADELRSIVARLMPALQEARTDAAHYKLQYQMLTIESAEAVERIQVEMDLAQRELEVLQAAEQQQQQQQQQQQLLQPYPQDVAEPVPVTPDLDPSLRSVHVDLYDAMVKDIKDLKSRNTHHESTISHQKRMIVQQESEIASMNDRILLLRERLQENRDHLNRYRRPSIAPESTPRSERSTPYRASVHQAAYTGQQRPFAALLHATDIMSHAPSTAPVTPKRKRDHRPSMPVTPQTAQPRMSRPVYETPQSAHQAHLKVPMSAPAPRIASFTQRIAAVADDKRGHESDGTVSATDDSEAETEVPDYDDRVEESQASALASDLLRTPTRPQQAQRGPASVNAPLTQSRLFGHVTKSAVQRNDGERQTKKPRSGDRTLLGIASFREA